MSKYLIGCSVYDLSIQNREKNNQTNFMDILRALALSLKKKQNNKKMVSSISFGQVALKFCLFWESLTLLFIPSLAHWASASEKILAQLENYFTCP